MELRQYAIVLVNLEPTLGSEIKKTRPCVIVSSDEMNQFLRTLTIVPMTTRSKNYPTRVSLTHAGKKGWMVVDQIRTIDKQRIVKVVGKLNATVSKKLKAVLKETFID